MDAGLAAKGEIRSEAITFVSFCMNQRVQRVLPAVDDCIAELVGADVVG